MPINIKSKKTLKITYLAMMTALVVVFYLISSLIKTGIFATCALTLIPIVIGAALCGPYAGAWLGGVFAAMVLITGDAAAFLAYSIPGTIIVVLFKGVLAGLVSGFLYSLISRKNKTIGVIVAALAAPIVNTGIFLLGCSIFFIDTIAAWGVLYGYSNTISYMFFGLVGTNFLIELSVNAVLCPAIIRVINYINEKKIGVSF